MHFVLIPFQLGRFAEKTFLVLWIMAVTDETSVQNLFFLQK